MRQIIQDKRSGELKNLETELNGNLALLSDLTQMISEHAIDSSPQELLKKRLHGETRIIIFEGTSLTAQNDSVLA